MAAVRVIERDHGLVAVPPHSDAGRPGTIPRVTARSRRYASPGRDHRTHVRFTADEYTELADAAARAGLTTTGYVGEAALAAARGVTATGEVDTGGITRAELAALQRELFAARTALIQAAAELRGTPAGFGVDDAVASCVRSVAALDAVVARIHRQLQRSTSPAGDEQRL
jgi:uncharacterized protein (DUF1778 family)